MEASVYITILCVLIALFCCSSNGENVYQMTVVTSNVNFAGTDNDVTIILSGLKGYAQKRYLTGSTDFFEINTRTRAIMTTEKALGDLTSCQVERHGTDHWRLSYIVIVDESSNKIYVCDFYKWIHRDNATAKFIGCRSSKIGKQCLLSCHCRDTQRYYSCYNNGTCKQGASCEQSWSGNTCQKKKVSYSGRRSDGQGVYVYHLEDGNKLTSERIHATDPYVSVGVELENNIIVAKSDIFAYNTTKYQICRSSDINLYHYGEAHSMVCQNFTYNRGWHNFMTNFKDEQKFISLKAFGDVTLDIAELTFDACNLGTYGEDCSCICDHCINLNCNYSGHCLEGHISGVTGPLCSVCPKNCICDLTGICAHCVKGWFGDNCDSQCNPNCQNEECDKSSGKCNSCSPGFFKETCEAGCPSPRCLSCHRESGSCSTCSGQFQGGNCTLCKDGYFGSNCDQKCPQNCSKCTNLESCFQCKPGWFGRTCSCEEECLNPCDKTAGKCIIGTTVALPKVTTTGMSNCRIDNCKVCSVDNTTCLECKIGFTGVNCESSCSRGCIDSGCDRSTAECLWGCSQGFEGPLCNQASQDENNSVLIMVSVAGVAGTILLVAIIVLVIVLLRRKRRLRRQKKEQNLPTQKFSDLKQNAEISDLQNQNEQAPVTASLITKKKNRASADLLEEIGEGSIDDQPQNVANHTDYYSFYNGNKIPVDSLWEYTQEKKAKDLFDEEFTALQNGMLERYEEAVKSTNVSKNRYKGIYPYDHNRIVLDPEPGISESDYINASYINGFSADKFYIASMGPFTDETVIDIWRMIWQTNVNKIVMLTNLTEEGKEKCKQYWPEVDQIVTYGNIKVTCTQKHVLANYTLRCIDLWKDNENAKTVLHFHFTIWPDRGVPRNVTSVVEFRNKVRNTRTPQEGPTLVHCSAGIGRTGTYLALDYLIDQGESTKSVEVIDCVISLRHQRAKAVQTSEQYEFIYDALAEALNAGRSTVPTDQFHSYYRDLMTKNKRTGKSKLQEQYELLVKLSPTFDDEDFATAKLKANKPKHRYSNISAADRYRIYLQPLTSSSQENDYINAIFLPAYKERNAFLLTEMPLTNTIEAFWHMVFQENSSSIIMLNNIKKDQTFGTYWPVESKEVEFGRVQVTLLEKEGGNGPFDILKLKALYNTGTQIEEKVVKQFQCKFWPGDAICPPKPHPMLELMESVMAWQRQTGNQPTVVHCMNGAKQSGLYCALFAIIERLRTEHDVSVFQTILQLRTRRGQIVPNKDQLEFCYETVLAYLESFNMYSNFG